MRSCAVHHSVGGSWPPTASMSAGVELEGIAGAGGIEDRADDVGDEVGLVALHEVSGGIGDDLLGAQR